MNNEYWNEEWLAEEEDDEWLLELFRQAKNVYCIIKMYIIADEKCAKLHVQNAHFCRAF